MSVYDKEAFHERVSHAARYFRRYAYSQPEGSRAVDTCFEMFDGDAVAVALIRRAATDEELARGLANAYGLPYGQLPRSFLDSAEKYKDEKNLSALARRLREAAG